MIKVSIYRDGTLTNAGSFLTQEEAEAWISYHNFQGDIVIEDETQKLAQEAINAEALAYLASTDWLIIRELDCGEPCPEEIKQARQEARSKIVK